MLALNPSASPPNDAEGRPVPHAKARVDDLIEELSGQHSRILIPTPVLAEVLVRANAAKIQEIVDSLNRTAVFQVEPFDQRAAIEHAILTKEGRSARKARRTGNEETWAKLKFDWQIIAIAKVNNVTTLYSDDLDLRPKAERANLEVIGLSDLPLPKAAAQKELAFGPRTTRKFNFDE